METQQKRWVSLSYAAAAVLLGYLVFAGGMYVGGSYDVEARVKNYELVVRGLSFLMGLVLYVSLSRHKQVNQFMGEVVSELSRVSWPTQRETGYSTLVVIVMVVISGLILGFFDYLWTVLLKSVL